jgi:putative Holliday junction resolvase
MTETRGRILAIDYGKRRIGVAISDPLGMIASGLPTIVYESLPQALTKLADIAAHYQVSAVVVGQPLTLKGEDGEASQSASLFIASLRKKIAVPVYSWDERFTSVLAQRTLRAMGKAPSRNKHKIDELSAVFLLQSYLDRHSLISK